MRSDLPALEFQDSSVGRFPKETWTWVHVWTYRIRHDDCSDVELLQALMDDETFAYSYVAPYPHPEVDGVRVHGPFVLRDLSITNFVPTTLTKVAETLESFLSSGKSPHSVEELSLEAALPMPLPSCSTPYELLAPQSAFHRMGRLIGDYSDFVVIDHHRKELKEIVLGFD